MAQSRKAQSPKRRRRRSLFALLVLLLFFLLFKLNPFLAGVLPGGGRWESDPKPDPIQQGMIQILVVRGPQKFPSEDIGDFIIRRSDGSFAFFFVNAVDDALMGVTHVLRGEDHLTNTPRQIALLQAMELPIPTYGHISLIVDAHGAPLSKRGGSLSVQELREIRREERHIAGR